MKIETRPLYPWEPEGVVVRIETPEQTIVEYAVATFSARLGAALIDAGIIFVAGAAVVLLLMVSVFGGEAEAGIMSAVVIGVLFLLPFLYFLISEILMNGQSVGKRAVGCRVISSSGHRPSFLGLFVRNVARYVDALPFVWLVPGLDTARRRIGDFLAGTLVVMLERSTHPTALAAARLGRSDERQFSFPSEVAERLAPDDINLLEYFFSRRRRRTSRLPVEQDGAQRIAGKYVERLGLEEQVFAIESDPDRFLRELYVFLRERFDRDAF